jgi:uncharacterized membrane protein
MSGLAQGLTLASAIGAGVVGGVFFAFSTFVMPALRRLPVPTGITAMQSINRAAPTPLFMLALFGTAATCVALAIVSLTRLGEEGSVLGLVGSAIYLVVVVTTMAYNVPRNDALDAVDASSSAGADLWRRYLVEWVAANHVRTVAGLASAVLLTLALLADW